MQINEFNLQKIEETKIPEESDFSNFSETEEDLSSS